MSLRLHGVTFRAGMDLNEIRSRSGLFAVVYSYRGNSIIVDLGHSRCVRDAIAQWHSSAALIASARVTFLVHYTPELSPMEREILANRIYLELGMLMKEKNEERPLVNTALVSA